MSDPHLDDIRSSPGREPDTPDRLADRIRAALTGSPVALFSQDRELRYTWAFNFFPELSEQEIIGKRDDALFSRRDAEILTRIKFQVLETGLGAREEVSLTIGQETSFFDLAVEPVRDGASVITGIAGAAVDITSRKHTEQSLAASEERYRAVSELLFGYVYSYRVEQNFKMTLEWLSGDFTGVTGMSVREAEVRSGWTNAINPEDRDIIRSKVRSLLGGREDVSEYRIFTRRGETRWVRDFSRPIWDKDQNRVVRIYGAIQDITARKEAADALRESEQRFRLLAENSADMIYRMHLPDGVYEYVSPASTAITGYTPADFYRTPMLIRKMVHPDWREHFEELWARVLEGDIEPSYEYLIVRKGGGNCWMYQRNTLVRDWEGRPVAVEGIVSDITSRKEAERELQESEERFRRLAQATVEGVVIHENGVVLDASETFAAMLGYTLDEVIGAPVERFVAPESRDLVRRHIEEGFEQPYEAMSVRKDGTVVIHETTGRAIPWHGRTVRVSTIRDITERKHAELALRESEERYRSLFMNDLTGDYLAAPDGTILLCNPAFAVMFGFESPEAAAGRNITELCPVPEGWPGFVEDLRVRGRLENFETTMRRLDGVEVRVLENATAQLDRTGALTGIVGYIADITERKRTEAALDNQLRLMQTLLDNLPIGVFMVEAPSGRPLVANEQAKRMLGRGILPDASRENLGEVYEAWRYGTGERYPLEAMPVIRGMYGEASRVEDMEVVRPDGSRILLEVHGCPVRDAAGNVVASLVSFMDITERSRAEEALRESEERFRTLVETTSDWVWVVDEQGRYTYASPRSRDIFGYEPEEVLGRTPFDFMPPEEKERVFREFGAAMERREPFAALVNENIRRDGSRVVLETSGVPIFDPDGTFRGYRGIDRDITERWNAVKALRESEERYRDLVETTSDWVWAVDEQGRFSYANPRVRDILGYEPEEMVCRKPAEFMPPEEAERMDRLAKGIWDRGEPFTAVESVMLRKDGSRVVLETSGEPVFGPDGEYRGYRGIARDITARKKTEEELRHSQEQLRFAMEAANEGLWDWNLLTGESYFSPRFYTMLGYEPDEFPSRYHVWRELLHPDDAERTERTIRESAERQDGWYEIEFRMRTKDGGWRWILSRGRVIERDPEGRAVRMIGTHVDITDRKLAEEAVLRSESNFRAIFNSANDVIFIHDAETGAILDVNEKVTSMYGYSVEEACHLGIGPMSSGIPPYTEEGVVEKVREALERGEPLLFEWQARHRSGRVFWVEVNLKEGTVNGRRRLVAVVRDISERKRTEEALRLNTDRLETLQKLNRMGDRPLQEITDFALEEAVRLTGSRIGYLALMNEDETVMTMYSWSREAMRECDIADKPLRYPVESMGLWGEAVRRREPVITNDYSAPVIPGKHGYPEGHIPLARHMNVPVISDGRIVLVAGVGNKEEEYTGDDVRQLSLLMEGMWGLIERKRSAEALRASEEMMRYIVRHDPNAIAVLDRDMRYVAVSERFLHDYEVKEEEVVGKLHYEIFPELPERWKDVHARCLGGVVEGNEDDAFVRPDGSITYNRWECRPWYRGDGEIGGIVLYTEVTTERKLAELALRESESKMRALFAAMTDIIMVMDAEGRYLEIAPTNPELLYRPVTELIGKTLHDVFPPEHADLSLRKIQEALETRRPTPMEYSMVIDDAEYWFSATISPLSENSVIVVARDITERKRSELALRESEEKYRRIVETANEGIWAMDKDRITTFANSRMAEILGYSPEDMTGRPVTDFMFPEDIPAHRERMEAREQGENGRYEQRFRHRDGHTVWLLVSATALKDDHGSFAGSVAMFTDISRRKEAEDALRESEKRFSSAFIFAAVGMAMVELDGRLRMVNRSFSEMLGYTEEELCSKTFQDITHPDDLEADLDNVHRLVAGEIQSYRMEKRYIHREGQIVWAFLSVSLVRNENGLPLYFISQVQDITARKEMEQSIARLRREYESFMRHELKNLFVPIRMYVELLAETTAEGLTSEQLSYLRRIRESADRAAGVIDSLKRLQDIEAGRYTLKLSRCSLRVVIRQVVRNLTPIARRQGVVLRYSSGRMRALMPVDRDLMPGVFSNLILNAIEHVENLADPEEKIVRIELSSRDSAIVVRITNRGEPVPPDRLATFFDKFNADERKKEGVGLGTTYALLVTRAHGGTISVTSSAEEGTTVTLIFPVITEPER